VERVFRQGGGWLEIIERLWDDIGFYEQTRQRCWLGAEDWRPEVLAPQYEGFFRKIMGSLPLPPQPQ
jgi:hypothetical protein